MNDTINKVVENLKEGKIGIFPTDTAFGLGCRIDRKDSIKRIFDIKKRPKGKQLLALVSTVAMANDYVFIPREVYEQLIKKYWPGALTIVLKCKNDKVKNWNGGFDTLALRFPKHDILQYIIEKVGVPIVAPSANFSGEKTPLTFDEVDKQLIDKVDFALSGVCTIGGVSTIIDCTKKPWKIIRKGIVEIQD